MIEPWSWEKSNATATDEETVNAYKSITSQGFTTDFSSNVWNDLVYKTTEVLDAFQRTWDDSSRSLNHTLMIHYAPNGELYSQLNYKSFNALVGNIHYPYWSWAENKNAIGYLGRRDVWAGVYMVGYDHSDIVYGSYFIEIAKNLNVVIGILNGTVNENNLTLNVGIVNNVDTTISSLQSKPMLDRVQLNTSTISNVDMCKSSSNKINHICSSPIFQAQLEAEQGFEYATSRMILRVKQVKKLLAITNFLLDVHTTNDIAVETQSNIYQSLKERIIVNHCDCVYSLANILALKPNCFESENIYQVASIARAYKAKSKPFSWNGIDTRIHFKAIMDTALGKGSIIDILTSPCIESLFIATAMERKAVSFAINHCLNAMLIPTIELVTPTLFEIKHIEKNRYQANGVTRRSGVVNILHPENLSTLGTLTESKTKMISHICPLELVVMPNAEVGRHSSMLGKTRIAHYFISRIEKAEKVVLYTSVDAFSYEFKANVEKQSSQKIIAQNLGKQSSFSSLDFLRKTLKIRGNNNSTLFVNGSAELIRYCYIEARTELTLSARGLLVIDTSWEYPIQIDRNLYFSQGYETVGYKNKALINPEGLTNSIRAFTLGKATPHTTQSKPFKASNDGYVNPQAVLTAILITEWEMPVQEERNLLLTQLKNNIHTDKRLEVV